MKKIILSLCLLIASTASLLSQTVTETYRIKQMRCDDCAHKVMVALTKDTGVKDINFNLERRTATITYDKSATCLDSLKAHLSKTRYRLTAYDPQEVIRRGVGFKVEELKNADQAKLVEKGLYALQGVDSVVPHLDKQWVFVRYDTNRTEKEKVRRCLSDLGLTPVNYYTSPVISYALFSIKKGAVKKGAMNGLCEAALTIDGVDDAWINAKNKTLAITYVKKNMTEVQLQKALQKAGIKVSLRK